MGARWRERMFSQTDASNVSVNALATAQDRIAPEPRPRSTWRSCRRAHPVGNLSGRMGDTASADGILVSSWCDSALNTGQRYDFLHFRRIVHVRRITSVLIAVFLLVSCSSKSPEEKAAEDALKVLQQTFGTIDPASVVEVDEEIARTWPEKFCRLVVNMTRDEVRAVMGIPTRSLRDQNFNQDSYEAWGYDLTIFYDIDDRAEQIQPNSDNVPCETKFRP